MFLPFNFCILFPCFWDPNFLDLRSYFSDSLAKIWFHILCQDCPEDIMASKDSWVEQLAVIGLILKAIWSQNQNILVTAVRYGTVYKIGLYILSWTPENR